MANNQGFLTGTGGASSAYTVAASDIGSGVLAQQFHETYYDIATSTWKTVDTTNRLPVALASSVTVGATAPTVGELLVGKDSGGLAKAIAVDTLGQIIISNPSSGGSSGGLTDTQLRATPVPVSLSGSATSALQTSGNTTLTAIDSKLGGTLTVNSNAVTDTQLRATPLAVSLSGSATAALQTTGNTSLDAINTKLGSPLAVTSSALTDTQLRASALPTSVSNFPATQAVSATALPLPTGAATSANQSTAATLLSAIDTKLGGTLTTTALTDAQLRATALGTAYLNGTTLTPVSLVNRQPVTLSSATTIGTTAPTIGNLYAGSDSGGISRAVRTDTSGQLIISNFPTTQAVSATTLPLPTGAATSANQTTTNTSIASVDSKLSTKTINSAVALNTTLVLTGTGAGNTNVTVVATVAAVQLASNASNQFVTVQNSNASAGILYYGYSSGVTATTGFELKVGELINLPVDNTNRIWLFSASGATAKIGWV